MASTVAYPSLEDRLGRMSVNDENERSNDAHIYKVGRLISTDKPLRY